MLLLHLYQLVLMLALTFAPCVLLFALCILTFAPCACGVSLLSTGATIPGGGCHQLQLALVVLFIHPMAQLLHLHSGILDCVVVVCAGGNCMWRYSIWWWWYIVYVVVIIYVHITQCGVK